MKIILFILPILLTTSNIFSEQFLVNSTEVERVTNPKVPFGSELQNQSVCTRMQYCSQDSDYIRGEPRSDEFSENFLVCICSR